MLTPISEFFNALVGASVAEVIPLLLTLCVIFILLKKFFEVVHLDSKLILYTAKIAIAYVAISALGGFQCGLSFS